MYRIEATDVYSESYEWDSEGFTEGIGKNYDIKEEAEAALAMAVMTAEDTSVASLALLKDDKVVKRVYFDRDI
nr:MAG TPA: hypothetical protein [Caudoviricetes sp.]